MKVDSRDIVTEGELGGRKIEMTLDQNSLTHLMGVLSDLYSNPTAAVIREYTTNALDSHVKAGQTRPVEISAPNRLNPFFKVQDFGVGMSETEIEDIFSKYGSSTKRNSNDEVGMLGLGSKSAFTYTEQFSFIAVKDGVKIHAVISRDESGAGSIEIADSRSTSEHNGVIVMIPVTNVHEFNEELNEFVRYLPENSVLVNDNKPDRDLTFISDNIAFINPKEDRRRYYRSGNAYVVMGGVRYPISSRYFDSENWEPLVFFVDIGEVNFTPNREELHYTTRTISKIESLSDEYENALENYIKKKKESAEDFLQVYDLQAEISKFTGRAAATTFEGIAVPDTRYAVDAVRLHSDGSLVKTMVTIGSIRTHIENDQFYFVDNWKNKRISKVQGQKIAEFLKLEGYATLILGNPPEFKWMLKNAKSIDWDAVKKQKVAITVSKPRRKERLWTGRINRSEKEFLPDKTKKIVYISKSDFENRDDGILNEDDQLVYVTKSEEDTFLRRYPKAVKFQDVEYQFVRDYIENPTDKDKEYLSLSDERHYGLEMYASQINDPKLRDILSGGKERDLDEAERRFNLAGRIFNRFYRLPDALKDLTFPKRKTPEDYVGNNYSLLESVYTWRVDKQHLVIYANAVYEQMKEEQNG